MISIRPPAVAGHFYPGAAADLRRDVEALLAAAVPAARGKPVPKAIISPHAGYMYSGATAAAAYARLQPARDVIRRVVLLGPVHQVPVRGLVLPAASLLATPLGNVMVDAQAHTALSLLPQVGISAAAHAQEHSLEVQLPFLQCVLSRFSVVPLAVGDASAEDVAQVLDTLWGGAETLIVVSSDFSHYKSYAAAQALDRLTAQAILELRSNITHEQACGGTPLNGMALAAARHRLRAHLVEQCNSGDTAGDRQRVVGYGAFVYEENAHAH